MAQRWVILGFLLLVACGKKDPAKGGESATASVVGKWAGDYRGDTIEFEVFADGTVLLNRSGRRQKVLNYKWLDARRVRIDDPGEDAEVVEVALSGDDLFITDSRGRTHRCRRAGTTPADPDAASPMVRSNERNASGTLKTFATAQADFRSNDRDNNRVTDFWTGDIAGLYAIDNTNTGARTVSAIKLVEVSAALADLSATSGTLTNGNYGNPIGNFGVRSAKAGYWYIALREDLQTMQLGGNGVYALDTDGTGDLCHNTSRFGCAAIPESYGKSGRYVYIINEGNTMFYRDFGRDVLTTGAHPPKLNGVFDGNWPTDADLANHWKMLK